MKVHLSYTAMLKIDGPLSGDVVETPDGATAGELLAQLRIAPAHRAHVTIFVNEERIRASHVLREGDRVHLAVPISGG
jgi:sulfur carrier protein ThiS